MVELRSKVVSGIKWSVGAKLGSQVISWGSTIIVMRLLHPDDYGLLAMATVFIGLCLLVNQLGLGVAIVQAKEISDRMLRQAFGLVLLFNILIFLILFVTAPLVAHLFHEERVTVIVQVLALQFVVMSLIVIPKAILNRNMNFRAISIVEIFVQLTSAITTLLLAWYGLSVWALVIGTLVGTLVRTVGFNIASPFLKLPTFNFSGFKDTAKFGGFLSLQQILWYAYSQADVFIIGRILGKTLLGYYSVAMEIASLPMQKVGSIINQVALPAYATIQENRQQAAEYVAKSARTIAIIAFPLFFGISSVAPELVRVVLGEKWIPAIVPLQLLSLIVPLRTIQISLVPAVNGLGRPDINARNIAVACVVMPLSFLIGVQFGLVGVSLGWIIGYSLWFLFMLTQSLPVLTLPVRDFLATLYRPLLFSALMFAGVYATRLGLSEFLADERVILGLLIAVGTVIYGGAIWMFARQTLLELWSLRRG